MFVVEVRAALTEGSQLDKLNSGGIQAGGTREGRRSVGRCGTSRRRREGKSRIESCLEF